MDIMSLAMARKLRGGGGGSPSGGGDSCGIETVVDNSYLLEETTLELGDSYEVEGIEIFTAGIELPNDKYNPLKLYTLTLGEIYTVTFNNKDYKCELKMIEDMYYLGSDFYEAIDHYEEPFCIMFLINSNAPQIYVDAFVKDVTISIKFDSVRIKESYIPRPYIFDLTGAGVESILLNTPSECYIEQDTIHEIVEAAKRDGVIGVYVQYCHIPQYVIATGNNSWTSASFFDGGDATPVLLNDYASNNVVIYMHLITGQHDSGGYIDFAGLVANGGIAYMRVSPFEGKVTTISRAINFMT